MSFVYSAAALASLQLYSANQASRAQKDAAKYQAQAGGRALAVSEFEAEQINKQAGFEVKKVRDASINLRAQQIASQAASGVVIGDGTTQAMLDETTALAEQDVMAILYNASLGKMMKQEEGRLAASSSQFQARQLGKQSELTLLQGIASAGSTLASGSIKSSGPTTTPGSGVNTNMPNESR